MEFKEHKVHNLHNAVNDLPTFEAPPVWHNIERNLPAKKKNWWWLSMFVIFIAIVGIVISNKNHLSEYTLQSHDFKYHALKTVPTTLRTDEIVECFTSLNQADQMDKTTSTHLISIPYVKNIHPTILVQNNIEPEMPIMIADTVLYYHEIGDNLVPNYSFENYNLCPQDFNHRATKKFIPDWKMASKGTPDYFNKCAVDIVDVPENFAGTAYPKTGNAYAGIILRQNFTKDNRITGEKPMEYREYIQACLTEPLIEGVDYCVKFNVCLASNSRFAVDAIGAYLSNEMVYLREKGVIDFIPQIENLRGEIIDNQDFWVEIEGVFTAKGGEKYITIGNFRHNIETYYMMFNHNSEFNFAYYYIDDVSVFKVVQEQQIVYSPIEKNSNIDSSKQLSENKPVY